MLTKVIRILDVNINMDKFYMSIFVYVLESRLYMSIDYEVCGYAEKHSQIAKIMPTVINAEIPFIEIV